MNFLLDESSVGGGALESSPVVVAEGDDDDVSFNNVSPVVPCPSTFPVLMFP